MPPTFTECVESFFSMRNFNFGVCGSVIISKCLGMAIIAGSSIVKLPQLLKIWSGGNAEGLSLVNSLTDLFAITAGSSYSFVKNFPFSSYGEGVLLGIQTLAITLLILLHNFSRSIVWIFFSAYCICISFLLFKAPIQFLTMSQALAVPIMFYGKMMQALANYRNKGTGQLSLATCAMLLGGSLARVFTSFQETGDSIIIITYLLASLGNAIIVGQFVYYRNPTKAPKKKLEDAKKVN